MTASTICFSYAAIIMGVTTLAKEQVFEIWWRMPE
jgi:hypothetical protein